MDKVKWKLVIYHKKLINLKINLIKQYNLQDKNNMLHILVLLKSIKIMIKIDYLSLLHIIIKIIKIFILEIKNKKLKHKYQLNNNLHKNGIECLLNLKIIKILRICNLTIMKIINLSIKNNQKIIIKNHKYSNNNLIIF